MWENSRHNNRGQFVVSSRIHPHPHKIQLPHQCVYALRSVVWKKRCDEKILTWSLCVEWGMGGVEASKGMCAPHWLLPTKFCSHLSHGVSVHDCTNYLYRSSCYQVVLPGVRGPRGLLTMVLVLYIKILESRMLGLRLNFRSSIYMTTVHHRHGRTYCSWKIHRTEYNIII